MYYVATEAELAPPGLLAYLGGLYMSGTVSASVLADITDHVCAAGTDGLHALEQIRVSDASKNELGRLRGYWDLPQNRRICTRSVSL